MVFELGGYQPTVVEGPGSTARTSLQAIPASLIKKALHCSQRRAGARRRCRLLAMLRAKIALPRSQETFARLRRRERSSMFRTSKNEERPQLQKTSGRYLPLQNQPPDLYGTRDSSYTLEKIASLAENARSQ